MAIQEAIIARHVLRLRYWDRHDVMTCRDVESMAFAGTWAHAGGGDAECALRWPSTVETT